ncbi:MAG: ATP-binding cassette domain-containing protein [Hydrogenibacillus sp.]|nr:ATP-binding cassette domain-containing protein [Hydrogenibacillus sp.]
MIPIDPEGTARVFETIAKIASGRTLVIVEHNIEQALPLVERLIVLDERGRIALDGDVARTFARAKADLLRYGVWYPGAWEDMKRLRPPLPPPEIGGSPRLEIADFAGYIGREAKIVIERATVRPGEWIAITGPNGAGKSVLLYALRGLIRTSGTYRIDGRPATQTDLTRMFGFVFQNPEFQFVAQTVAAEIGYTPAALGEPPARVQSCVASALDAYRLGPYRTRHPFHLSLGQKRRLSVAAATAHAPPLWLLDEPTFGQDAQNAFALLDAIEHAREHGAADDPLPAAALCRKHPTRHAACLKHRSAGV